MITEEVHLCKPEDEAVGEVGQEGVEVVVVVVEGASDQMDRCKLLLLPEVAHGDV
jgi:hypothetical protein